MDGSYYMNKIVIKKAKSIGGPRSPLTTGERRESGSDVFFRMGWANVSMPSGGW